MSAPPVGNNSRPIASLVDLIAEFEREMVYYLQNPDPGNEGLDGAADLPVIEAPTEKGVDLKFFLGDYQKYLTQSRPFVIWALGAAAISGAQSRSSSPLGSKEPRDPRPFATSRDMIRATLFGALDPAQADHARASIRGCERLRWALLWSLRAHWGGAHTLTSVSWMEITSSNQIGYALDVVFSVPMSLLRPNTVLLNTPPLALNLERVPDAANQ